MIDGNDDRIDATPVDDRGHTALTAETPGFSAPGGATDFGAQRDLVGHD
jgi:hypothetical protein